MNSSAVALGPLRFVRMALLDYFYEHRMWPQRVVLHTRVFHEFMAEYNDLPFDVGNDPTTLRINGSVRFMYTPIYPSIRFLAPYLVNNRGQHQDL